MVGGKTAHYIFRDSIESDTTWSNSLLPIVVYGYCYVKPGVKLTINPGMQIHYAPYSWLFVEGELEVNGSSTDPVLMQGDRLQPSWEETAGQWGGIWFSYPSRGSVLEHAVIKNGTVGVYCDSISGDGNSTPNVSIKKCFIRNMAFDGVAGRGSYIRMENSISSNCGRFTFLASFGGKYDIRHSTFHTGNRDFSRQDPTFAILNINRDANGVILSEHPIDFYMVNSIVDGNFADGEIGTDLNASAVVSLESNLLRTLNLAFEPNNILNRDTIFENSFNFNYQLDSLSAATDEGTILSPAITDDIANNARDAAPDLGAYESTY